VVKLLAQADGGGTDCAQPILWAAEQGVAVDAFVILTDSQTWAGQQHPAQAVQMYRRNLVVVAMAANRGTIGEAEDAGVLNVVGFDTATP
jgi:60 kDa SS-A/Ro ribonucleoprotein